MMMQTGMGSNTERLEFDPENAPPGLVEVQNRAFVRNKRRVPGVYASDFLLRHKAAEPTILSNNIISHSSEKVDLLNIMECFARTSPRNSHDMMESVYAISNSTDITSDGTVACVDQSEDKLCSQLAERYISNKSTVNSFTCAMNENLENEQRWPILPAPPTGKRARVRSSNKDNEEELLKPSGDDLTGLDGQLFHASKAHNSTMPIQTAHFPEKEVKAYKVHSSSRELLWEENYCIKDIPVANESFRAPAKPIRQLISDRLFLLDDHCFSVKLHRKKTTSSPKHIETLRTSKDKLIKQATARLDASEITRSMPGVQATSQAVDDLKKRALENALARHTEALTDAALEMVFQYCVPIASQQKRIFDLVDTVAAHGSSSSGSAGKRKINNFDNSSTTSNTMTKQRTSNNDSAQSSACADNSTKGGEAFSWETILQCLHSKVGENSSAPTQDTQVVTHQNLPALHLSTAVLERTERRLRALYRGETDAHSVRAVPSIFDYSADSVHTVQQASGDTIGEAGVPAGTTQEEPRTMTTRSGRIIKSESHTDNITRSIETGDIALKMKLAGKLVQPRLPTPMWEA